VGKKNLQRSIKNPFKNGGRGSVKRTVLRKKMLGAREKEEILCVLKDDPRRRGNPCLNRHSEIHRESA